MYRTKSNMNIKYNNQYKNNYQMVLSKENNSCLLLASGHFTYWFASHFHFLEKVYLVCIYLGRV